MCEYDIFATPNRMGERSDRIPSQANSNKSEIIIQILSRAPGLFSRLKRLPYLQIVQMSHTNYADMVRYKRNIIKAFNSSKLKKTDPPQKHEQRYE